MKKILISAPYMLREREKVASYLKEFSFDVTWADVHERLEEADLLKIISDFDGIICGDDRLTSRVYDHAKKLKVVVKWGTGIDSVNMPEAEKRGVKVFRTPGAFTDPVADTTLGLILAFARGLRVNDDVLKSGGWDKPQGYALSERTVGIIGLGEIGTAVARRLRAFGARILANDVASKDSALLHSLEIELVSKQTILEQADYITLHCDLNETSYRILGKKDLTQVRKRPVIVNTARGPLIDEPALICALQNGTVAGAGLDVFELEPLPKESPLRSMKNVFLASHNSNTSPTCWDRVHRNSVLMLAKGLGLA